MYLLVFVFLVISLLGVYAQVFAVQSAQMFSSQTAAAQLMMDWHDGAVGLASANVAAYAGQILVTPQNDCSMTLSLTTPATACAPQMTTGNTAADTTASYLPPGYLAGPSVGNPGYQWNSIFFQIPALNHQFYTVTYAAVPANLTSPILSPAVGVSGGDLLKQLGLLGISAFSYGAVSSTCVKTGVPQCLITVGANTTSGGGFEFPLPPGTSPAAPVIPNNSIAVISEIKPP